jgi:hypothetical protein
MPELAVDIVEVPQRPCIGDVATFVVMTKPRNVCFASVGYGNIKGIWLGRNFESVVADDEGLCEWTWQVADDASVGTARFRAEVEGYGHVASTLPQPFDIKDCSR